MSDIEWRNKAACLSGSPELFFPQTVKGAKEALQICQENCKVRAECAKTARDAGDRNGVHGGFFLPTQIRALARYVDKLNADETTTRTCVRCGAEMFVRVNITVCGACRADERNEAVNVGPVREHVEDLRELGWTQALICERAKVSQPIMTQIVRDRRSTVPRVIAEKILGLPAVPALRVVNA